MPTILDQLARLPTPYCDLALLRREHSRDSVPCDLASVAIDQAFLWSNSPEGDIFWERVTCAVEAQEGSLGDLTPLSLDGLPPIPESSMLEIASQVARPDDSKDKHMSPEDRINKLKECIRVSMTEHLAVVTALQKRKASGEPVQDWIDKTMEICLKLRKSLDI